MNINEDLTYIEAFLRKTLKAYEQLTYENQRLKEENAKLLKKIKETENDLSEIDNKSLNLQVTNHVDGDNHANNNMVSRIDEMIEEIDNCLKLLKSK